MFVRIATILHALGVRTAMGGAGVTAVSIRDRRAAADVGVLRREQGGLRGFPRHHATGRGSLSIDEAFLDVRGLHRIAGPPEVIAARLRAEVLDRVGLPITRGAGNVSVIARTDDTQATFPELHTGMAISASGTPNAPCAGTVPRVSSQHIGGDVPGIAIQTNELHGGVYINAGPSRPAPVPAAQCWADISQPPLEIMSLMRAQMLTAQELPYRLRGARKPSLATVYVRQDLGSGQDEPESGQPHPTPVLDVYGQLVDLPVTPVVRPAVRAPSRTVRQALDSDAHLLVTGGPGQGKSTLSLRLAADICSQWTTPGEPPLTEPVVPLRLPARELAARLDVSFSQALAAAVQAEYGAHLRCPVGPYFFEDRVAGCRWLLLVDGLDEVASSDERDRLVKVLAGWATDAYRIVLTTRPIEGAALAPLQRIDAARYELQPFDEVALKDFALSWFEEEPELAHRFVRQIHAAYLDELVRVPLLATIAAIVFEQQRDRPLPDNQYELYDAYLRYLRTAHPTPPSPFDDLLEHLALVRLETDRSLLDEAGAWAATHVPDASPDELSHFLTAVGPLTHRASDVQFLHHSFAEHLAATAKARQLPAEFSIVHEDFVRLLHAARPVERGRHARAVLLHHTRLNAGQADRLITALHAGDADEHLLAARLLGKHAPAGPSVVNDFLVTVKAWAMTTQGPSRQILAQASRATHHPGLADWLAELMRNPRAPWQSQVEAATALAARLRGEHSEEALAHLHAAVDDASAPTRRRLAAAEALADCGSTERAASERGLRAVLKDKAATGANCRAAAVVLAGFDGPAREHAARSLARMLDDPEMPIKEQVEIATGLLEIGFEFHERCAGVFRAVLSSGATSNVNRSDAAAGLASLGPQHLAEAVSLSTAWAEDRRNSLIERRHGAAALAGLGPQYRVLAGELLLAMAAEPGMSASDRLICANELAELGPAFRQSTAELLRDLVHDRSTGTNAALWAARALVELGPGHHDEVAGVLADLAVNPLAAGFERAAALGTLAKLDASRRTAAIAALRANLADWRLDAGTRGEMADELVQLSPDFHAEVAPHLLAIATGQVDPDDRLSAWQSLARLSDEYRQRAAEAMPELVGEVGSFYFSAEVTDIGPLAEALTDVVNDAERPDAARLEAARNLANLGREHHRAAVDGALTVLDRNPLHHLTLSGAWTALGPKLRHELMRAQLAYVLDSDSPSGRIVRVAGGLLEIDDVPGPDVLSVLQTILDDDTESPVTRAQAAVLLAEREPARVAGLADLPVLVGYDDRGYAWRTLEDAMAIGAQLGPGLRAVLGGTTATRAMREDAARVLVRLDSNSASTAIEEFRHQAADDFLEFQCRTEAVFLLTEVDRSTWERAVDYLLAVLHDEHEPVETRGEAAYQLGQLDRSRGTEALSVLSRLANSTELTVDERVNALRWLRNLSGTPSAEARQLALAAMNDPRLARQSRELVGFCLLEKEQREFTMSLVADHTLPVQQRAQAAKSIHDTLAETVIRDVLAAPETSVSERAAAACALADLSPRNVPEAAAVLKELHHDGLARMGRTHRHEMIAEAKAVAADENQPWRERKKATALACRLSMPPPDWAVAQVQTFSTSRHMSDRDRIAACFRLRMIDAVRAMRDDARSDPVTRWQAARKLREYDVADRAVGARILDAIANDASCRPALRWQAARDLALFGSRGRAMAATALSVIADDVTLPDLARVHALRALGDIRPDQRGRVIRALRSFRNVDNPLQRILILSAIGWLEPDESARTLRDMANDPAHGPVARLRAAAAMLQLRSDFREAAAIVAREVAQDATVPRHVRAHATRHLARWSELCREEARTLLSALLRQGESCHAVGCGP